MLSSSANILKSIKISQSYREFKGGNFFWDTVYIIFASTTHCNFVVANWLRIMNINAITSQFNNMQAIGKSFRENYSFSEFS